jgi:alpha-D-ribose 1-methylphosphonate 5-triphosphate diphosphatase
MHAYQTPIAERPEAIRLGGRTAIRNVRIVTPDGILDDADLVVAGQRIEGFVPAGAPVDEATEIDGRGGLLAPGFIDIHADYIEHIAAPRPTSMMDFRLALREAERELAGHGITTMFHSLSLYKTSEFGNKPIRDPENVAKLVELIHASHSAWHLIRHRFHARYEIDNLEQLPALEEFIRAGKVHLLSFMDHSPGQGQYRNLETFRHTLKGYRKLSESELDAIITHHQTKEKVTLERIGELIGLARSRGIAVASHDDDSVEKVRLVRSWGTGISEFPITMEVAKAAREAGMHTVAGAPNILLGGSHSGNLGAAEAILAGAIDILCSDYYPAALLHAVFLMHRKYGQDLAAMFRLVSLNPARAVGMDAELGSIEPGKRADLLLIEAIEQDFPVITACFVDGQLVAQTHYRC